MRKKLTELSLTEEQMDKITEILKDEIKDKYVPLSRFNEVNEQVNKLKDDVKTRDEQIDGLKKSDGDMEKLKARIDSLQAENQKAQQEYEAKINGMRRDEFVKNALMEAGLLDAKFIPGVSAYLPISDLNIDDVSSVANFNAKLAEAKTITSSWFKSDEPPTKEINGMKINDPASKVDVGQGSLDKDSYEFYLNKYSN